MGNFVVTDRVEAELMAVVKSLAIDRFFVLVDENTAELCLSQVDLSEFDPYIIKVKAGDESKTIDTAIKIWNELVDNGATRSSLLVNLGGGVVTDLGGFGAPTFKRGMRFVNIPTTLLGVIDAATGGKTGINFRGLKNEIGTFALPEKVLINPQFFETLDFKNRLSGYAEMVKHALIADPILLEQTLAYDLDEFDNGRLSLLLKQNLDIKEAIVERDPNEKGQRKALNFGHTVGHAFESLSYEVSRPMLHGFAVMWGMVVELYLSFIKLRFNKDVLMSIVTFAKEYYGTFPYSCKQYDKLYELMTHDKKNSGEQINFTLLAGIGDVRINQNVTKEEVFEALDFIREI